MRWIKLSRSQWERLLNQGHLLVESTLSVSRTDQILLPLQGTEEGERPYLLAAVVMTEQTCTELAPGRGMSKILLGDIQQVRLLPVCY